MMCKIDEWKNYMSWKERERSRSRDQDLLSTKKVTPTPPKKKEGSRHSRKYCNNNTYWYM